MLGIPKDQREPVGLSVKTITGSIQEEEAMFRCENCGSGYSMRAASSWESCPRCLAREKITVPLTFELGWRGTAEASRKGSADAQPTPLKRVSLDRGSVEEPSDLEVA